jgi:pimeloyl-ACP methyl ester carboxylesterase
VLPDPLPPGPLPLVLNFHGFLEPPKLQQLLTGMDKEASKRGMIVAYPQGVGLSWNAGSCCGRAQAEKIDDVRYARDLVRELESELCIDKSRVYATGMSNGAIMSYRLACEAADVFAAVAPVDGVEALRECSPRRPVPILAINGTSDLLVRWEGGWFELGPPPETLKRVERARPLRGPALDDRLSARRRALRRCRPLRGRRGVLRHRGRRPYLAGRHGGVLPGQDLERSRRHQRDPRFLPRSPLQPDLLGDGFERFNQIGNMFQ